MPLVPAGPLAVSAHRGTTITHMGRPAALEVALEDLRVSCLPSSAVAVSVEHCDSMSFTITFIRKGRILIYGEHLTDP